MKAIALAVRSPLCHSCFRCSFLLISLSFLLVCFAFCQMALAVSPAPDGGYAGNNTAEGTSALFSLTSGADNTAIGFQALFRNTSGTYNSGEGFRALFSNTTGFFNTATGVQALNSNTIGAQNTATGVNALFSNTTASYNTANGTSALFHNTTGSQNTATGVNALTNNTTGNTNTADGVNALYRNTSGSHNTATGVQALFNNTGSNNTATGYQALYRNTTGPENTATGYLALNANNTGFDNTANGAFALESNTAGYGNTANGHQALDGNTTGAYNTAIGYAAGLFVTGNFNVCIGSGAYGVAGEDATTRISNIYASVASGRAVYVNSDNKLGTLASSQRFKDEIKPMNKASEALLALKPVTFRYKKGVDPTRSLSFGLIAEEVAEVDPDLVTADRDGKPETVRYEAVNAMLLNEFLKEHSKVEELKATVAQQQREMQTILARLKEHEAKIQKVSAQVELRKPAPSTILND
jgi:trimeric autotransporter adhesin